ncbi:hypothetical protein GCM10010365_35330 [Streptomyces poonensis]|uniref:Uncharacterized protein n=1 Tax=Streptomyces poonensis TaxID=68255 RepID=A0A918PJ56_9ACTN|nr:hypothetical protein GCM10010365_35330 [Streptomyces poonensis]GLJ92012.1 hypothetical protein GCM10017589_46200 [Streptomyces poonensis]
MRGRRVQRTADDQRTGGHDDGGGPADPNALYAGYQVEYPDYVKCLLSAATWGVAWKGRFSCDT